MKRSDNTTRRRWLVACGSVAAGCAGVAGCLTDGNGGNGGNGRNDRESEPEATDALETRLTESDWPLPNVDPKNSRHHPTATGPKSEPIAETTFHGDVDSLAIDGDTVYLQQNGGDVFALDRATGEEAWSDDGNGRRGTSFSIVYRDTLYVVRDETVVAFDSETGEQLWAEAPTGATDHSIATVVPVDDALYIGSGTRIHRFDPENGDSSVFLDDFAPHVDLDTHDIGGSIADDGTLYLSSSERVAAFDLETGAEEWRYRTSAFRFPYSLSKYEDVILWGNRAIDAETGEESWRIETDYALPTRYSEVNAVANGTMFGVFERNLSAYDLETGTEVWSSPVRVTSTRNPAVADGVVYVADGSTVSGVDAETGDVVFSYDSDVANHVGRRLLVSDGTIYTTGNGTLYTFEESDAD